MNSNSRRLPPLQPEDHIALLRALVIMGWVAVAGAISTELWVRSSPLEWPTLGGFAVAYRGLTLEFATVVGLLTLLLVRRDWYERVPRVSADRVRWLLMAVVVWMGLHLAWAFHATGALSGPVAMLIPLFVMAALMVLPQAAGWWTSAYLLALTSGVVLLEHLKVISSPGQLAPAFAYGGPGAERLGIATLLFGLLFAVVLALELRRRSFAAGRVLAFGSAIDPATGLFHRLFLLERLEQEITRARRYGNSSTLLLIRIEDVTESDPSAAEDQLRALSDSLLQAVRLQSDSPSRYGPATLAALLPTANRASVRDVVGRIDQAMRKRDAGVRLCFGAALIDDPAGMSAAQIRLAAEAALCRARPGAGLELAERSAGGSG